MGAGKLNAGDALNVAASIDPPTVCFGPILTTSLALVPHRALNVTNLTGTAATFTFTVQPIVASTATVKVSSSSSSSSLDLGPGAQDEVSVSLTGTSIPSPGSYEGYILVNGPAGTPTLRVPYQFLVDRKSTRLNSSHLGI